MPSNAERVADAIEHLKAARDLLRAAGARKTLGRCNLTLSSAKGAHRHAHLEPYRRSRQGAPA